MQNAFEKSSKARIVYNDFNCRHSYCNRTIKAAGTCAYKQNSLDISVILVLVEQQQNHVYYRNYYLHFARA